MRRATTSVTEATVDISIVSGWLPVLVGLMALAALGGAFDWRRGTWRRQLTFGVPAALVLAGLTALLLGGLGALPDGFPAWPFLWGGAVVVAVVATVTGWRRAHWPRRTASVIAVVLLGAVTLNTLNTFFLTYPTLGRLIDLDAEHYVSSAALQALVDQTRATGRLPAQGVVVSQQIPVPVSHFDTRPAFVYLPPAWFATPRPRLPTLVLLPGEPGSAADWTEAGDADDIVDRFAAGHDGKAPIVVMPDPDGYRTVDSECVNSQFGEAETYLTIDVPAFARRTLDAADGPDSLAVAGLSAGGTCSVVLALRHPAEYSTFASYSGFAQPTYENDDVATSIRTLFGGSRARFAAHDPVRLLARHRHPGLAGWFEVGDSDTVPRQAAATLSAAAGAAGIDTCVLVRPGGHDFGLWSQALTDSLPWLSWRLGLTGRPDGVPATCRPPVG